MHIELMHEAVGRDADAHRALLAGELDEARAAFAEAAALYRQSWDTAPPRSYGRLVGMLKSALLSGAAARDAAGFARRAIADSEADLAQSPTAAYASAIAALVVGADDDARAAAAHLRSGTEAHQRTADAIDALIDGDRAAYAAALEAIVRDFEGRLDHLTGVPIADTALMLEVLAAPRGLAARLQSPLLPELSSPMPVEYLVRAHLEAVNSGDRVRIEAGLADDVVWITGAERVEGRPAVVEFVSAARAALSLRLRLMSIVCDELHAACELRETSTVESNERTVGVAAFYTVREGLISRVKVYREGGAEQ